MRSHPQRLEGRETGQDDGLSMARGVVVGVAIGLAFWAAVIVLCVAVSLLA